MKTWTLRGAMLAVVLVGVVALGLPAKAKAYYCCYGAYCETKTSAGSCGGADACWCYGADGSEKYDAIDCAFL
jgi:hypothetical protein